MMLGNTPYVVSRAKARRQKWLTELVCDNSSTSPWTS